MAIVATAAVDPHKATFGVAVLDLSTGEFNVAEYGGPDGLQALARRDRGHSARARSSSPAGTTSVRTFRRSRSASCRSPRSKAGTSSSRPRGRRVLEQLRVGILEGFGLERRQAAVCAAGALLRYLRDTQKADLAHVRTRSAQAVSRRPADRSDDARASGGRRVDARRPTKGRCCTRSTARSRRWAAGCCGPGCCGRWLRSKRFAIGSTPSRSWRSAPPIAASCARRLKTVQDLERLTARVALSTAGPRDLVGLRQSLAAVPRVRAAPAATARRRSSRAWSPSSTNWPTSAAWIEEHDRRRAAGAGPRRRVRARRCRPGDRRPPAHLALRQAGDRRARRTRARPHRHPVAEGPLQSRLRLLHRGLEVEPPRGARATISASRRLPAASASSRRRSRSTRRKSSAPTSASSSASWSSSRTLRRRVAAEAPRILDTARALAALDVLAALAETATVCNYTKPLVDDGDALVAVDLRHPVVERLASGAFVPNDVTLNAHLASARDPDRPEHGRQVDVPATGGAALPARADRDRSCRRARPRSAWSIASTRASARRTTSRAASRRSWSRCRRPRTSSTARPSRSLVVLDEIGRGTATFDGLSIAWAVAEHLAQARARPAADAVRHALSRADRSRRRAARRGQRPRHRARVEGRHRLSSQDSARPIGSELRHSGGASGRACRRR